MRRFFLLPLTTLFSTTALFAQTLGLDTLGGAKYPDEVRRIPNQYAIGFFAETFGDAFPVVKRELEAGRSFVRVHLIWSDSHTFGDADIPKIRALSQKYQTLCAAFNGKVEISPFCEHNLPNPDKYLDIAAQVAPNCRIVNTPWKGRISRRYKNEIHRGNSPVSGPYNFSFDGTSSVDSNIPEIFQRYKGSEVFFLWVPQFNLRKNTNDTTPRPQRKAVPTKELIESVRYLAFEKGETSLPNGFLWKSHADQHQVPVPESRALKPVLIAPTKGGRFELVANNNRVIATSGEGQAFKDGRSRYYFNDFGYKIAEKVKATHGAPVAKVRFNGRVYGKVNPAHRQNDYRH